MVKDDERVIWSVIQEILSTSLWFEGSGGELSKELGVYFNQRKFEFDHEIADLYRCQCLGQLVPWTSQDNIVATLACEHLG